MMRITFAAPQNILHFGFLASLACVSVGIARAEDPGYKYFVIGQPSGVIAKSSPGYALMGGGADQEAAFEWLCERACDGNFVILRASGSDAYNPYVKKLCPALSAVETLIITSRAGANQPFVAEKIRAASALFIAGGSQDNYINFWRNTPVDEAINALIKRGTPVGGTSAGLAVLGEYSFAALNDTIKSSDALRDPFDPRVTLTRDFLHVPLLAGIITDSHFVARDRMGRLLVFLARIAAHGWTQAPSAIGIDEKAAVLLNSDGTARVVGEGAAYFLRTPGPPERCVAKMPLTYRNISVYRLTASAGRFQLKTWTGAGGLEYRLSAEDGVITSTLGGNQVYGN